jgi:trimeric autotransporter adhesin
MKNMGFVCCLLISGLLKAQTITLIAGGGTGGDGGAATSATVFSPQHMAFDRLGNLYFSQNLGHKIRKISTTGVISTIAGTGMGGFSGDGGSAVTAQINQPAGLAIDTSGNIYFCDNANCRVRRIAAVTGIITTIAGTGVAGFNGDGIPASAAQLNYPQGLEIDKSGNIYISDGVNHRVRKIDISGVISTIAGDGSVSGGGDGVPATATACNAWNVGFDGAGNIYISDGVLYTVRKINTSGIISTVAGKNGLYIYDGDGVPATAACIAPATITVDINGVVYIADGFNDRIRRVNNSGIIETIAGDGTPGYSGDGGLATASKINNPSGLLLDTCGNLFFSQIDNPRIRKIEFNPSCAPIKVKTITKGNGEMSIYPNPAINELTITAPEKISSVAITNIIGQTIVMETYNNKERVMVDVGHLPVGVYVVRVNERWVKKFVKE